MKTKEILYKEALNQAIAEEMERDPKVILYGEDVGRYGGLHGVTRGLWERFGGERVMDTPISEEALVGFAGGLGACGYRPIVEILSASLITCCFSPAFFMLGFNKEGCPSLPVVVRLPVGVAGGGDAFFHNYSPESLLMQAPYLKIVAPSTPCDAKGLLKSAIRSDRPVMFFEHHALYNTSGQVPVEEYLTPIGKADIKRAGRDVTIVTYSAMVRKCLAAAEELAGKGIDVEVVDLRSLVPLDEEAILNSVKKTGKLVIVHEALERAGPAGEITAIVAHKGFAYLRAPIIRVTTPNVAMPKDARIEDICVPQEKNIIDAVQYVCSPEVRSHTYSQLQVKASQPS